MYRVVRGIVAAFLVGGVVATVRPATAQFPNYPPRIGHTLARKILGRGDPLHSPSNVRLQAIKVRLALLGNSDTFRYDYTIYQVKDHLELRGDVPNETIQDRSLAIARGSTFLRIVDNLHRQGKPKTPPRLSSAASLRKDAVALLANSFGEAGRSMEVQVQADGQIVVSGSVGCLEDKLAVSKRFRQLPACTCVKNQLKITPVLVNERPTVLVTRDGSYMLPASALPSELASAVPTAPLPRTMVSQQIITPAAAKPPSPSTVQPASTGVWSPLASAAKPPSPTKAQSASTGVRSSLASTAFPSMPPNTGSWSTLASKGNKTEAVKPPAPLQKWGPSSNFKGKETSAKKTPSSPAVLGYALVPPGSQLTASLTPNGKELGKPKTSVAKEPEMPAFPSVLARRTPLKSPGEKNNKDNNAKTPSPILTWHPPSPSSHVKSVGKAATKSTTPALGHRDNDSPLPTSVPNAADAAEKARLAYRRSLRLPTIVPTKTPSASSQASKAKSHQDKTTKLPKPSKPLPSPSRFAMDSTTKSKDKSLSSFNALKTPAVMPKPKSVSSRSFDARAGELSLPTAMPSKPNDATGSARAKNDKVNAPKLPIPVTSRKPSAMSWESDGKGKAATKTEKNKGKSLASKHPSASSGGSTFASSPALTAPPLPARWRRPGSSEPSEPRTVAPTKKTPKLTPLPTTRPNATSPLSPVTWLTPEPPSKPVAQPIVEPPSTPTVPPSASSELSNAKSHWDKTAKLPKPLSSPSQFATNSPAKSKDKTPPSAKARKTQAVAPKPKSVSPHSFDARDGELSLPIVLPSKPHDATGSARAKNDKVNAPKLPIPVTSRKPSAMSWESDGKGKAATQTEKNKEKSLASKHPSASSGGSTFASSPTKTAPPQPAKWRRPGSSEKSEPRTVAPTKKTAKGTPLPSSAPIARPSAVPPLSPVAWPTPKPPSTPIVKPPSTLIAQPSGKAPSTPTAQPAAFTPRTAPVVPHVTKLERPSRWPPAYETGSSSDDNGHEGVIEFDDEAEEPPSPAARTTTRMGGGMVRPIVPAQLKQKLQSLCGRQARAIFVEMQRDGSILVRVKVANATIGNKLTHQILTVPEMASPKVRLTMDTTP